MNKVVVTGGTGLLGKSLKSLAPEFMYLSSKDIDLTNFESAIPTLEALNPSSVIHLAAKVGGIKQNVKNPFSFLNENNKINTSVINYCVNTNTPIVFASSSCAYPKQVDHYPMTEDMVQLGEPEETNDGYAYAKRFAGCMLKCAQRQYGLKYTTLFFCNLFGENDDFYQDEKSHLVTALIHKFHNAKTEGSNTVQLLGTGRAMRQFLYSMDAAKILKRVVENKIYGEYNVCSTENLTIDAIANLVSSVVGYTGRIEYNGLLDGVYRKDISNQKLTEKIGDLHIRTFKEGLEETYSRYLESLIINRTSLCGN